MRPQSNELLVALKAAFTQIRTAVLVIWSRTEEVRIRRKVFDAYLFTHRVLYERRQFAFKA